MQKKKKKERKKKKTAKNPELKLCFGWAGNPMSCDHDRNSSI